MKEEARIAREQHLAIVNRQKQQEEEEKAMKAQRQNLYNFYKVDLNEQMDENEVNRQNKRHEEIIEGKKTRMLMDQERNRIQMIQAQKLSNLQAIGTSEKYTN